MSNKKVPVFTVNYTEYSIGNEEPVTEYHQKTVDLLQEVIAKYEQGLVTDFSFTKREGDDFTYRYSCKDITVTANILELLEETYSISKDLPLGHINNFGLKGGDSVNNAIEKIIKAIKEEGEDKE